MTRTARYNAETNIFRELPGMEKPDPSNILGGAPTGVDYEILDELMDKYLSHKNSLREIPCHESCKGVFIHDCDYEEGRDYKVYPVNEMRSDEPKYLAYPAPVKSEDEDKLWYQVKDLTLSAMDKNLSPEEWVGLMKGLYHITPR